MLSRQGRRQNRFRFIDRRKGGSAGFIDKPPCERQFVWVETLYENGAQARGLTGGDGGDCTEMPPLRFSPAERTSVAGLLSEKPSLATRVIV